MVKGAPRQKCKGKKADEMFTGQPWPWPGREGPRPQGELSSVVQIPMAATLGPSM